MLVNFGFVCNTTLMIKASFSKLKPNQVYGPNFNSLIPLYIWMWRPATVQTLSWECRLWWWNLLIGAIDQKSLFSRSGKELKAHLLFLTGNAKVDDVGFCCYKTPCTIYPKRV